MEGSIVPVVGPRFIARTNPAEIKQSQAKLDAIIEFAAKVKDWPLVHDAIAAKIDDQAEFVGWWEKKVRKKGGDGGYSDIADLGYRYSAEDALRLTGISPQQNSRWKKELGFVTDDEGNVTLERRDRYHDRMVQAIYRKAGLEPEENHRAEGTAENEWFTPAEYIAAAREVMGDIDLDPASNPIAQNTVQALNYFTAKDDGLKRPWHGRVWLNPPYAQPLIGQFVAKMVEEFGSGRTTQAIMLTHNYTDTQWFHAAEAHATWICFTRGRIKFVDIDGSVCAPTQGQAFFYFGDGVAFCETFKRWGFIR